MTYLNSAHINKADIHMHSTASDGGYSPEVLMKKCVEAKLELLALTDHDTTVGLEIARETAESLGARFIDGIELSTRINGQSVDILGYGFDIHSTVLQETLSFHRKMRRERMDRMMEKCQDHGISITIEDIKKQVTGETYSRPHLAKAIIEKGYAQTVQEVFEKYLGYGKPCYVVKEKEMEPSEAIKLIHQAGGVAIVAHPIFYNIDEEIETWFSEYHLDGIEVFHRDHDEEAVKRFLTLALSVEKKLGKRIFKTGGSDFHHESFGRVGEEIGLSKLPYEEGERLYQYIYEA
ncbi:histidinol phosphatase [Salipaludibacillus neizhouensis]|uniref:Histidinol phosphatase n=1 Tax=Salipaludibacillus neizhouensis TaxID=885475 RepID=A0A3A9KXL5_9BACI|nr:PHP domain-containing protein [Salipaludibacillus neizhouensis]RKL69176.1 histidinol phosphatase [Salipaludibacillus neizhouensis]